MSNIVTILFDYCDLKTKYKLALTNLGIFEII